MLPKPRSKSRSPPSPSAAPPPPPPPSSPTSPRNNCRSSEEPFGPHHHASPHHHHHSPGGGGRQRRAAAGQGGRIPLTLQAVFLASNRGKRVDKPPPGRVAFKVFKNTMSGFLSLSLPPQMLRRRRRRNRTKQEQYEKEQQKAKRRERKPSVDTTETFAATTVRSDMTADRQQGRSKVKAKAKALQKAKLPPQAYLEAMLRSRGYTWQGYDCLKTAYYNRPTPLQVASYNLHLLDLVPRGDKYHFLDVMQTGISLNPCNEYGESLLHTICRRGDVEFLKILVNLGASVQVADDYGRTPLHDACWTARPNFCVVEELLNVDPYLLQMRDCRGALPLSYVLQDNWAAWLEFLESKKDVYWPAIPSKHTKPGPPPLTQMAPNCRPIPDPENALSLDLAAMVAKGRLSPAEVAMVREEDDVLDQESVSEYDDSNDEDSSSSEDSSSLGSSTFFSSDNDDDLSDVSFDDDLMMAASQLYVQRMELLTGDKYTVSSPTREAAQRAVTALPTNLILL